MTAMRGASQAAWWQMRVDAFTRSDWAWAAGFFLFSLTLRVPFRSQYAYHWDSVQFALAIDHYDLRLSLPHRPGYFLYVMLGRLVNVVVGEPHTSLVWMSVVAGAALAALGFLLGAALFGRGCGLATATILATSPLCWFHSEVALTTIVDGALVTATMLICWRAMRSSGGWPWLVSMAIMFGIVAGVRPQTGVILLPCWLYALFKFSQRRWAKFLAGLVLMGLTCLSWVVPMVALSGGLGMYIHLLRARMVVDTPLTSWGGGSATFIENLSFIIASCWVGLFAAGLLAATEIFRWAMRGGRADKLPHDANYKEQVLFLGAWTMPMICFGLAVFTLMPGYTLSYFPAIAVIVGVVLDRMTFTMSVPMPVDSLSDVRLHTVAKATVLVIVGVVNVAVFLVAGSWTRELRAGLPVTASDISNHDAQLAEYFQAVRAKWTPSEILVCHYGQSFYWGFRHFQYYLPEYDNCSLTVDRALAPPFDRKLWYAKSRDITYRNHFDVQGKKTLVLVVPPGESVERFAQVFDLANIEMHNIDGAPPLYSLHVDRVRSR